MRRFNGGVSRFDFSEGKITKFFSFGMKIYLMYALKLIECLLYIVLQVKYFWAYVSRLIELK